MTASTVEPFVGRSSEVAALTRALADAQAGRAGVVLVEGEAGFGKTVLVQHFLREVRHPAVLRVSASEAETAVSYGVLAQLVSAVRASALQRSPGLRAGPAAGTDALIIGS